MRAMAAPFLVGAVSMPRAYSQDLRDRVLGAAHAGEPHVRVARRFAVGESTVRSWLRRERRTGSTTPRPNRGATGHSHLGAAGEALLRTLVADENARTLAELAAALRERAGLAVSVMSVWRACRRLDLRREKKEPAAQRAGAPRRGGGARDLAQRHPGPPA